MSLSDCTKCWCTPCECGYDYKSWSKEKLKKQISMLQGVLKEKDEYKEQQVYLLVEEDYGYSATIGVFSSLNKLRGALKKHLEESEYAILGSFDYRIISFMMDWNVENKPLFDKRIMSDGYPIGEKNE